MEEKLISTPSSPDMVNPESEGMAAGREDTVNKARVWLFTLQSHSRGRVRTESGSSYKIPRPSPDASVPPVRLHLLKVPQPPQNSAACWGSDVAAREPTGRQFTFKPRQGVKVVYGPVCGS